MVVAIVVNLDYSQEEEQLSILWHTGIILTISPQIQLL